MRSIIKDQYQIVFKNSVLSFPGHPKKIFKSVSTINEQLTEFLIDWRSVGEISSSLLPDINSVLDNSASFEETASETIGVSNLAYEL